MNTPQLIKNYWKMNVAETLADLETSRQGLSGSAVKKRLARYGGNELEAQKKRATAEILISQFKSPLVLILLGASLISAFLGEIVSTIIIIIIVLISAILAFFQEYKSEQAVAKLRKRVALKATVIRDGKPQLVLTSGLVPGDLVLLDLGKVVPADLRLIETDDLAIDESLITGESFPAEKNAKLTAAAQYLPQAMTNLAFMGTHVAQGSGQGVVIGTAKNTELGRTAHLLAAKPQETEFQKGIGQFGAMLFRVILVFSLVVFLFLSIFKHEVTESLLFALAIAVGISPELLPVIITVNLSSGARKMAQKKVIIKRLMSIEDLGNIDVLCTDKTGTLTEGRISLTGFNDLAGVNSREILRLAWLCNSLTVIKDIIGNTLDEAIIAAGKREKIQTEAKAWTVIDTLAYDFQRRRMSVIAEKNGARLLICKGAAAELLAVCRRAKIDGQTKPIAAVSAELNKKIAAIESQGLRLILVAVKEIAAKPSYNFSDETGLELLGYLTFSDKVKAGAKESIAALKALGVKIKILTGDSELIARHLCQHLACDADHVLLGGALAEMTEDELKIAVDETDIFAKITPEHKLRIINAYKAAGHNVGFLGDGVNDAPALRAADVGISVDSAIDVAKEAADVVLLEKHLSVLADGIIEGRKTFANTLKYIFATISSNYGNMFSVAGAAVILPFMPMLPVQVLLLNFLSDFPMLAISSDLVDAEYLQKPKHWDIKVISRFMTRFGLMSSIFDYLTFGILLLIFKADVALFQTGWFWESFLTEVAIVYIVRTKLWVWQSRPSRTLLLSGLATALLVLFIIYSPVGAYFNLTPLPLPILLLLVAVTGIYFVIVEISKKTFYKKYGI